jgi:hypothetical protein
MQCIDAPGSCTSIPTILVFQQGAAQAGETAKAAAAWAAATTEEEAKAAGASAGSVARHMRRNSMR